MANEAKLADHLLSTLRRPDLGAPTDRQVANAHKVLAARKAREAEADAAAEVQCVSHVAHWIADGKRACGEWHPIRNLTAVQMWEWIPPSGCTEGGYHVHGELLFVCKCGYVNRTYNRPEVAKLKSNFGVIKDGERRDIGLSCRLVIK